MKLDKIAVIGAEVSGLNLCAPLSDQAIADIELALAENSVLFFREQELTGEQLVALSQRFGESFIQPVFEDRYKELLFLENDEKNPPRLNRFHQDMTCLACPPGLHLLHALVVPDGGGDTMWSCNYSAFEGLSAPMREFISSLTATHNVMKAYRPVFERMPNGDVKRVEIQKRLPPVQHPVVRTHPVTGRESLFVNRLFTERIDGLSAAESDCLLEFLWKQLEKPEYCVRLRWQVGTLAIWDNRCTSHYAVADYYPQRRRMQRASVCGEEVV